MATTTGYNVVLMIGDKVVSDLTSIDRSIPIADTTNKDFFKWEYYYRRGNDLYFRRWNENIILELDNIPEGLKRGERYDIDFKNNNFEP